MMKRYNELSVKSIEARDVDFTDASEVRGVEIIQQQGGGGGGQGWAAEHGFDETGCSAVPSRWP